MGVACHGALWPRSRPDLSNSLVVLNIDGLINVKTWEKVNKLVISPGTMILCPFLKVCDRTAGGQAILVLHSKSRSSRLKSQGVQVGAWELGTWICP